MPDPYYQDDFVTIYHADARGLYLALDFDVVVTDPPYGIGWRRGTNSRQWSKAHAGIVNDEDTSERDDVLAQRPGIPAVVFGSFYAPFPADVVQVLVWPKPTGAGVVGSTTGFRRDAEPVFLVGAWPKRGAAWSSVLPSGATNIAQLSMGTGHPHTKPVQLMRHLIDRCPPGVICDPFMGSGSTLRAAKDRGRKAIGIEIDERYCEVAARRLGQDVMDFGDAA